MEKCLDILKIVTFATKTARLASNYSQSCWKHSIKSTSASCASQAFDAMANVMDVFEEFVLGK